MLEYITENMWIIKPYLIGAVFFYLGYRFEKYNEIPNAQRPYILKAFILILINIAQIIANSLFYIMLYLFNLTAEIIIAFTYILNAWYLGKISIICMLKGCKWIMYEWKLTYYHIHFRLNL